MKYLLAGVLAVASMTTIAAETDAPTPFRAEYATFRNGEELGRTTLTLVANADRTFTLRSETEGTMGLAKIAGVHVVETSHFHWKNGRPEAIDYDYKQDSALKNRTRHATFDAKSGQVDVTEGNDTFRYAIVPGLIDRHAVTLAIAMDLKHGAKSFDYKVAVKDHVEDMTYERAGNEKVDVPAGSFDAVVIRRSGDSSGDRARIARSWFSSKIGWLPVQIEQQDKKDTVTLKLAKAP